MSSLKKLAIKGAIWTLAGYGTALILRFCSNLILTRLLVPEYFGLMAIINTLRTGLDLFSDLGISQSIISNQRGDQPTFLNTAWTLQAIRGCVLWLFFLLMTVPIANFYDDQRLLWLIPVVGLSSVFDGLGSTAIHTLHRHIDLLKVTLLEISVYVTTIVTAITWATFSPSIWALVMGTVAGSIYRMVVSHCLIVGYSNRFAWDQSVIREILAFGKWMFIATAITFLKEQADRLILAKLLTFQILGVYVIASTLAWIPRELIKSLSYKVIFPTISSRLNLTRSSLRTKILHQRQLILMGFAILLAALVAVGDLVITILYDSRYEAAGWMMPFLCTGIWFSVLYYTISPALIAIGKPLYTAQSNLTGFIVISLGLPLVFFKFGVVGAIIVIALSDLPLYLVNLYGLWREKLSCISQDIQSTVFFISVLATFLFIRNSLGFGFPLETLLNKS